MEIRDRIISKTHELFHRLGIRRVTMDEIATQLGISKKTIYQVFSDKDELVQAITEEYIKKNCDRCEIDKMKAVNAIHEIFLTMDMLQEMSANINPAVIYDLEKFHPKSFSRFNQFKDLYLYEVIEKNLKWGIEEGLYRPEMNKDVLVKLRLSMIFFPFNQDVFPQNRYNIGDVQRELLDHFLYGIATPKGNKLIEKYKQERI